MKPKILKFLLINIGVVILISLTLWTIKSPYSRSPEISPPFNGKLQYNSDGRVVLSQLKITSNDLHSALFEHIKPLLPHAPLAISGTLEPADMAPLNFSMQITPLKPKQFAIIFEAKDTNRKIILDGVYSSLEQSLEAKINCKISSNELQLLGINISKNVTGIAEFSGNIGLNNQEKKLRYRVDLEGNFASNAILTLGEFYIFAPQNFSFSLNNDGYSLTLPKAKLNLALSTISNLKIEHKFANSVVNIHGDGALTAPYKLSQNIPIKGVYDLNSRLWNISGDSTEPLFFSYKENVMQINKISLNGSGDAEKGSYTIAGSGDNLIVSPTNSSKWHGQQVEFSLYNRLNLKSSKRQEELLSNLTLTLGKITMPWGDRNIELESPTINIVSNNTQNSTNDVTLKAQKVTATAKDENLSIIAPLFSAKILANNGQLTILEEIKGEAQSMTLTQGRFISKESYSAQNITFSGNFNRLESKKAENLNLEFKSQSLNWQNILFNLDATQVTWHLGANFAKGSPYPYHWNHQFSAQSASAESSEELSLKAKNPMVKLSLSHADLTVREANVECNNTSFTFQNWQGVLKSFSCVTKRELDGWEGSVKSSFDLKNPHYNLNITDATLSLPIASASSDTTHEGAFEIKKIQMASQLIESLTAKISLAKSQYSWRGSTKSALLSNGGFFFVGEYKDGQAISEYKLPLTRLKNAITLNSFPNLPEIKVAGRLGCTGKFSMFPKSNIELDELQAQGDITIGAFDFANAKLTIEQPKATLNFEKLQPSAVTLVGGDSQWQLNSNGAPTLNSAHILLANGSGALVNPTIFEPNKELLLEFKVEGISPCKLLNIPLAPSSGLDNNFNGTIKTRWSSQGLEIVSGTLERDATNLALDELNEFRYIPNQELDSKLFDFANAALKKFNAEKVSLQFLAYGENIDLRLITEGKPYETIPFVLDNGNFRPKQEGELGFWGRVTITSDYRLRR